MEKKSEVLLDLLKTDSSNTWSCAVIEDAVQFFVIQLAQLPFTFWSITHNILSFPDSLSMFVFQDFRSRRICLILDRTTVTPLTFEIGIVIELERSRGGAWRSGYYDRLGNGIWWLLVQMCMLMNWSVADSDVRAVGVLDPIAFVKFVAPTHDLRCAGMEVCTFVRFVSGMEVERVVIYKQSFIEYS